MYRRARKQQMPLHESERRLDLDLDLDLDAAGSAIFVAATPPSPPGHRHTLQCRARQRHRPVPGVRCRSCRTRASGSVAQRNAPARSRSRRLGCGSSAAAWPRAGVAAAQRAVRCEVRCARRRRALAGARGGVRAGVGRRARRGPRGSAAAGSRARPSLAARRLGPGAAARSRVDRSTHRARLPHVRTCRVLALIPPAWLTLAWRRLVARRARREPFAHVVGQRAFFESRFLSDRRALVPRPASELVRCWRCCCLPSILRRGPDGARIACEACSSCRRRWRTSLARRTDVACWSSASARAACCCRACVSSRSSLASALTSRPRRLSLHEPTPSSWASRIVCSCSKGTTARARTRSLAASVCLAPAPHQHDLLPLLLPFY